MSRVLLTQIGKPRRPEGLPGVDAQYQTTTYELDGQQFTTPMMGFGLADLLKPDRMVMLGTTGSTWSALVGVTIEHLPEAEQEAALDIMAELEALEGADQVTAKWLEVLGEQLSRWYKRPVICQLTPYLENDPRHDTAAYLRVLDGVVNGQVK